ncbi:MAG TPA: hypothetical protein VKG79_01255 [Bryobacteraceae bacterium]|nr:hypothetical protein [Bryobacteraceae bacterium]
MKALTGLWRGIVTIRSPFVITICLLCRKIRNQPFREHERRVDAQSPEAFPSAGDDFNFTHVLAASKLFDRLKVFADRVANIVECFFLSRALRPAAW